MRVLFVCTDADVGGAERLLAMLGRWWDPEDTVELVVLMAPGTLSDELERAFSRVTYLDFAPTSRNLIGMVRALRARIEDFRPDVISSHLFHADFVAALARTRAPLVSTVHTHGFGPRDHWLTKIIARAVGLLSGRFSAFIPTSDSAAMRDFLTTLRIKNVAMPILNGTDIPAAPSFDPTSRSFASIARNHPVKGHAVLLRAFASSRELDGWRLRLIGPGLSADDPKAQELVKAAGVAGLVDMGRITLEGPSAQPEKVFEDAAALVISSLYGETFPLVGLEAAGHGVPVITSDVGNCASFADDAQFVVKPGDVHSLSRALIAYARLSDERRTALSEAARARALRDYDPTQVAARYRKELASAVTAQRQR